MKQDLYIAGAYALASLIDKYIALTTSSGAHGQARQQQLATIHQQAANLLQDIADNIGLSYDLDDIDGGTRAVFAALVDWRAKGVNIFSSWIDSQQQLAAITIDDNRGVSQAAIQRAKADLQARFKDAVIDVSGSSHYKTVTAYTKAADTKKVAADDIKDTIVSLIDTAVRQDTVLDIDNIGLMSDGRFRVFFNNRTYICRLGIINGQLRLLNDRTGGVAWQLWRALKRVGSLY